MQCGANLHLDAERALDHHEALAVLRKGRLQRTILPLVDDEAHLLLRVRHAFTQAHTQSACHQLRAATIHKLTGYINLGLDEVNNLAAAIRFAPVSHVTAKHTYTRGDAHR